MRDIKLSDVRSGFTLIEILIALAIGALITVTVIPWAYNQYQQSKVRTAKTFLMQLRGSLDQYQLDMGEFPESLRDLIQPPADEEQARKWISPYLPSKKIPQDPWGKPYHYERTPDGENSYELYSYGPQGRKGKRISVWDLQ